MSLNDRKTLMCSMLLTPTFPGHGSGVVIRPFLPVGQYPVDSFVHQNALFVVANDVAFSAVRCVARQYPSEQPWTTVEELRLLAALALSVPSDEGKVMPYPSSKMFLLQEAVDLVDTATAVSIANALRDILRTDADRYWAEPVLPAVAGAYATTPRADVAGRGRRAFDAVDCEDALVMRGFGALVKAPMLAQHFCFHTEACMSLHVAMEASGEMIRRRLRSEGQRDSYEDAGNYLSELFGEPPTAERYFADFYDDRIKAVHPNSRFGTFSDAPLAADDFYDLHESLLDVYNALVTTPWH